VDKWCIAVTPTYSPAATHQYACALMQLERPKFGIRPVNTHTGRLDTAEGPQLRGSNGPTP
jgi:hypothetical protein